MHNNRWRCRGQRRGVHFKKIGRRVWYKWVAWITNNLHSVSVLMWIATFTDHLSRAFGNLEYRLLHELNQLKAMLNLLLPPMYQNRHYFAQPHPALYQPLEPPLPVATATTTAKPLTPPSPSINKSTSLADQVQNESPLAVDSTTHTTEASARAEPLTTTSKTVDRADHVSERILEFRPVPKKQTVRPKFVPKYVKDIYHIDVRPIFDM